MSDEALRGATRSEPDAFAELYDRYESALIGYLLRRTGNLEVAVDLASEVFATALAAAHRYRPAPGRTAAAWLFTIAQNILRDSLRRGRVEARARRHVAQTTGGDRMTLLPEYRALLYGAAERRARRRALSLPRLWPVAVSTGVAVAVVVVAVAVLSHRHAPSAPPRPAPAAPAASGRLTSILGVLRRPQTEADRQTWVPSFFNTPASPGCRAANTPLQCSLRLDRPLIREVDVFGSRYRVGLLPYARAGKIAGLAVTLRGPGIDYLAAGPWSDRTTIPPGISALRTHGLMLSMYVSDGVNRGVIVVPDGVARVVLGPIHLLDTTISRRFTPIDGASAAVHDNVALFQLSALTVQKLELRSGALRRYYTQGSGGVCRPTLVIYRLPAVTHMIWLARDGRTVSRALVQFALYVGTHHPAPGTVPRPSRCAASG